MTGMPGFDMTLSTTEMWQVSLLLANADKLPKTAKDSLTMVTPPTPVRQNMTKQCSAERVVGREWWISREALHFEPVASFCRYSCCLSPASKYRRLLKYSAVAFVLKGRG